MLFETLQEIIAVASILIKFGHDDILENKALFIAFLNELGITIGNKKVTATSLWNLTQDITNRQKEALIEEFLSGHEPIYRKLTMVMNSAKLA
ncbi:anti-sigma factor [Acinetobacter phage ZZ1]|nr:anti-sigma factor [Acinetobacter phage ZZ1]AEJ90211.2 anti-sigma 70 protein [Acinetobacter phage ZZ1]